MYRFPTISYLDETTTQAVRKLQQEIFDLTGSRACLDLWAPHLTVGDGFEIKDVDLNEFYEDIQAVVSNIKPFELQLKDFSYLENWQGASSPEITPYVTYINIVPNESLYNLATQLREKISLKWSKFYNQMWPYTPHVTIAYKDLQKEGLDRAKQFLTQRSFDRTTLIDHVAIAQEQENKVCKEFKRFLLGKK